MCLLLFSVLFVSNLLFNNYVSNAWNHISDHTGNKLLECKINTVSRFLFGMQKWTANLSEWHGLEILKSLTMFFVLMFSAGRLTEIRAIKLLNSHGVVSEQWFVNYTLEIVFLPVLYVFKVGQRRWK